MPSAIMKRCGWEPTDLPRWIAYHDEEWGVPDHDDRKLFEFLVSGCLSSRPELVHRVLKKRPHFRRAFRDFDPGRVGRMTAKNVARLLTDPGIIRNRLKIESAIA